MSSFRDLTDVTLVSEDECWWRWWWLWCWLFWWKLMMMAMMKVHDDDDGDADNDGEPLWWWLLSCDESYVSQRGDVLWRFSCGDVSPSLDPDSNGSTSKGPSGVRNNELSARHQLERMHRKHYCCQGGDKFESDLLIPDICHFYYTGKISENKIYT